jgi:polar amino acid transport system substrate-binding protein
MTRSLKLLSLGLLLALGTLLVTLTVGGRVHAQAGDDWSRVQAAGKIVFGTSADYPPFAFYDQNFNLDGFDIALAQELGERMGVQVEFNDFAFGGLLDTLQLGQVDAVIAALSVTPDRQAVVDFTNLYFIDEDSVLVRAGNLVDIRSATDFAGLRVGVARGTTYAYWAQENLVNAGVIAQEALIAYADTDTLVAGLRNNVVDAILLGRLPAFVLNMSSTDLRLAGRGLNQQRLAIAVPKGSSLVDPLNQALLEIQADGTYAELVSQYLLLDRDNVHNDANESLVVNPPPPPVPVEVPCITGMSFVADLNLDDQNMTAPPVMAPGQSFVKSWRVRNSGTCAWAADYMLLFVSGNRAEAAMGAQPLPIGRVVQPGETIDLSMSLVAPSVYGVFQAFFQMRDNTGRLFGEVIWAGIQVPNPNPPTPTPVPPAPPPGGLNMNLRADSDWISAGQCTNIRWDIDDISAIFFVDGNNSQGVGGNDVRTVCPTTTTTYILRVTPRGGGQVDFPITINVTGQVQRPGPAITNFRVDRNEIRPGECVRLEWNTNDADGVNLFRGGGRIVEGGRDGSHSDCPPNGRHDYRLEAFGNGQTSQTVSVNVDGGRDRVE